MFAEYDLPAGSHRIGANRYPDRGYCNHRNMVSEQCRAPRKTVGPRIEEVVMEKQYRPLSWSSTKHCSGKKTRTKPHIRIPAPT